MTEKCFVDTNIFFYAINDDGSGRHAAARRLLSEIPARQLFISTQVLLELANVLRSKLRLTGDDLLRALDIHKRAIILDTTAEDVLAAVRLTQSASLSIWDAMIVTAAAKAGCETLYTEDLNDGQIIAGVRVFNPLPKSIR